MTDDPGAQLVKKHPVAAVLIVLVLLALLILLTTALSNLGSRQSSQSVETERDYSSMAFLKSKRFVTQALKAPSTAEFPGMDGYVATDLGEGKYRVQSYVDSQNGFGAMIRSDWTTVVHFSGGSESDSNNWELVEMEFDGASVYP